MIITYPFASVGGLCAIAFFNLAAPLPAQTSNAVANRPEAAHRANNGELLREGRPTMVWAPGRESVLKVDYTGQIFNRGQNLEVWVYLPERVSGVRVGVALLSRTAEINLSWIGWRRLVVPLSLMKPTTDPVSPNKLQLTAVGEWPADFIVHVQDARIVDQSAGAGITDLDLLDHLDLNRPELASVREAVEAGRTREALAALAAHFRQDFTNRLGFPADTTSDRAKLVAGAERLVTGEFTLGKTKYAFPQARIDWKFNPTQGNPDATAEWVFSINRHAAWETLAKAYQATRDDRYAEAWVKQLRSWVAQMSSPALDEERAGSGWRGLETGLRQSRAWPAAFFALSRSKAVTDADILLFLKSVIDHGNFLSAHPYGDGNHFLMAMCGLYTQGVVFPELKDAAFWRQHAITQLAVSLKRNVLPEGAWQELSPAYHQWVVSRTLLAFRTSQRNGHGYEVPAALWEKLQRMAEWNVRIAGPDGRCPTLNDGGIVKIAEIASGSLEVFPESALLKWAATAKDASAPPPETPASYAMADSGYIIMRTDWSAQGGYVLLDTGPLGGWHGHQDALNLVTYFQGRPFLFDNGGWAYDASIWRKYGPSTASHNSILVDGLGQWRGYDAESDPIGANSPDTPRARFGTSAAVDYASGWYVGNYGTKERSSPLAKHRREVALIKPAANPAAPLVVVVDTLTPSDDATHRYEARWHLLSTQWKEDRAARCLWTTDAGQPNLAILALEGAEEFHADSGVTTPEVLGWSYDGQNGGPYPALTVRHALSGTGVKHFITVLVPFKGDSGNPVLSARQSQPGEWIVELKDRPPVRIRLVSDPAAPEAPSFSVDNIAWPALSP